MKEWVCEASGLTVQSDTMPEGWIQVEITKSTGESGKHIVCSIWQAVDLMNKLANDGCI